LRVPDVTLDLLREMKDAGCIHIGFGFESASQPVLDSMRKRITVDEIRNAIELTQEAGIGVQGTFILGDPAECETTVRETQQFFDKYCKDHIVHFDYITPYPGSNLFRRCVEQGIITDKTRYYRSIHLRPRFNMTSMTHRTFAGLIEPLVHNRFSGFRSCEVVSWRREEGFDFDGGAPEPDRRATYRMRVVCPHCVETVDYRLPLKLPPAKTVSGSFVPEPVRAICGRCHKRFMVPTIDLTGLASPFESWVTSVQALSETAKAVVLTPALDEYGLETLQFYGFPVDDLNVVGFMDYGKWPAGVRLRSFRVLELTRSNIERLGEVDFVVLPYARQKKILDALAEGGVPSERIHSMPLQPDVSASVAHRRLRRAARAAVTQPPLRWVYNGLYRVSRVLFPRRA